MSLQDKIHAVLLSFPLAAKYKGNILQKLKYFQFAIMAKNQGIVDLRVDRLATWYTNDWFHYDKATKEEKRFLIERGYAPYKMNRYGLNKENYTSYLSDFELYSPKHYVYGRFLQLFEHKLNTYYLLSPFKKCMPRHYWYIDRKGVILPIDSGAKAAGTLDDIMMLIDQKPLAAKACLGGHGRGFFKLEKTYDGYFVNNKKCDKSKFEDTICGLRDYLITDYCRPNTVLRELCGEESYAVVRTLSVFDKEDGPQVTGAMIRLGCKKAGVVSDYDGTIYTGVGLEDGVLFNPYIRETDTWFPKCPVHPDTGLKIDGTIIPNWKEISDVVKQITNYIPWAPYLVIDIIPTDEGLAILEINSHGEVQGIEGHYPFCENRYNRRAFNLDKQQ